MVGGTQCDWNGVEYVIVAVKSGSTAEVAQQLAARTYMPRLVTLAL